MAVLTTNPYDPALMTQMLGVAPEGLPTTTAAAGGATTPAAPAPMDAEMARRILSGAQVGDMKAAQELYYGADGMGGVYSKTKGGTPDYDPKLDPAAALATTPPAQAALGGAARPPADMNALMEQSRREATANYARLQQQAQQEAGAGGPGAVDSRYRSLIKDLGDYNAARRPQWLIDNGAAGNPTAESRQFAAQQLGGYQAATPYQQPQQPAYGSWQQPQYGFPSQGWGEQMPQWGGQWGGQSPYQQRPQQQYSVGQNSQLGYTSWQPQQQSYQFPQQSQYNPQQQMNYGGYSGNNGGYGGGMYGGGGGMSEAMGYSPGSANDPAVRGYWNNATQSYGPLSAVQGYYSPQQSYNGQRSGGSMMGGQGYSGNTPYINNAMFGRQQGNQQRSW
jgi:hypothetical protein